MTNQLYIDIENSTHDMDSLIHHLRPYSINGLEAHSSAGVEIATLIISVGQFIVALIQIPMLIEFFSRQEIIVKLGGIKINNSVDDLLNIIKNNPDLLKEAKKALQNNALVVEGKGKAVTAFLAKLNDLINMENN